MARPDGSQIEVVKSTTLLKQKPSDYFYRQCIVSADPDETLTGAIVNHMGDDYFVWASDYPHVDASYGVLERLKLIYREPVLNRTKSAR